MNSVIFALRYCVLKSANLFFEGISRKLELDDQTGSNGFFIATFGYSNPDNL